MKGAFALLAFASFVLAVAPAEAQQTKKVAFVGVLVASSAERNESNLTAFRQGLRELGYSDGKDILLEPRYADGNFDRLPGLAAELVRLKVDVILVSGAPAAHAAKNATRLIPIVIGNAGDPVGTGLVASLARPGENITGLSDFTVAVTTKRLEILTEVVPSVSRVAVLLNPTNPTNPLQLTQLQAIAPALGVTLLSFEAKAPADIERAFTAIAKERAGAVVIFGDPMLGTHRRRLAELAAKGRLPAVYSLREYVDAGGLMSYGTNFRDLYRRAAIYVDRILKGAKPGDMPIEQPTTFELVINSKAATQIGLRIPPGVLARADTVIH